MVNSNSNKYFIAWTQFSKTKLLLNSYLRILVNVASALERQNQLQSKLQIQPLIQLLTQVQSCGQHQFQQVFYRLK